MSPRLQDEFICQEIQEQPDIARRHAESVPRPWPRGSGRVIAAGCGDSHAAAELLGQLLAPSRLEAMPAMQASRVAGELGPDDALLGISVSGRTQRVIEAAVRARSCGARVVAITDDPASPLAAEVDDTWPIGASPAAALRTSSYSTPAARTYIGYHHDVAQTKTFLAVLLTMARAADAAAPGEATDHGAAWARLPELTAALTRPEFYDPLAARAEPWSAAGQAFCLGNQASLPLARFACYKMFEFNRVAHFTDIEEYCHTHYFITHPRDAVILLLHDEPSAARAAEIAPTLRELFDAAIIAIHPTAVPCPPELAAGAVAVPCGGASLLERLVGLLIAVEWVTYLWGRIGAPDINTFHAGYDAERLVAGSACTIRRWRRGSRRP